MVSYSIIIWALTTTTPDDDHLVCRKPLGFGIWDLGSGAQAYREFCLMYDAFSVAEAVLPSRPSDQAAEVRIFHPPADDTKINRALLADGWVDMSYDRGAHHAYFEV